MSVGLLNIGVTGMQQSLREMTKSADQIAGAVKTPAEDITLNDISEPIINLKVQSHLFDASAKVVEAADTTIGALLDIKA